MDDNTKVYLAVVFVVDPNGETNIGDVEEQLRTRRGCSSVLRISEADAGQWSDDHPLNHQATKATEIRRLFFPESFLDSSDDAMRAFLDPDKPKQ